MFTSTSHVSQSRGWVLDHLVWEASSSASQAKARSPGACEIAETGNVAERQLLKQHPLEESGVHLQIRPWT